MKKLVLAILLPVSLCVLAGCGSDNPPETPVASSNDPSVVIANKELVLGSQVGDYQDRAMAQARQAATDAIQTQGQINGLSCTVVDYNCIVVAVDQTRSDGRHNINLLVRRFVSPKGDGYWFAQPLDENNERLLTASIAHHDGQQAKASSDNANSSSDDGPD